MAAGTDIGKGPGLLRKGNASRRVVPFVAGTLVLAAVATAALAQSRTAASSQSPTVSLRLRDTTVRDAYDALAKEAGVQFDLGDAAPADDPRLSLGLIQEPFW